MPASGRNRSSCNRSDRYLSAKGPRLGAAMFSLCQAVSARPSSGQWDIAPSSLDVVNAKTAEGSLRAKTAYFSNAGEASP